MQVQKILEIDGKCRYVGITDDLHLLHDLSPLNTWNYEMPTLVASSNEYIKKKLIRNNEEFKKKFFKKFVFLNRVPLTNLLVAGGCVRSLLLDQEINDVDIFVYGINDIQHAQKRIEIFIMNIYEHICQLKSGAYIKTELVEAQNSKKSLTQDFCLQHADNYQPNISSNIEIYYNGNTITLYVQNIKIQIILRLYNTISEILHGFDLGSSALGFDGNFVYFTSLGKFCFENLVNIVDCSRRSTTYEIRLIKYFESGFSMILPNLDITSLKTDYHKYELEEVCEMPHLIFSYKNIQGNSVYVTKFHQRNGLNVKTDYDFYGSLQSNQCDNYELIYYNISQIVKQSFHLIFAMNIKSEIKVMQSKKLNVRENWSLDFHHLPVDLNFIEKMYNGLSKKLLGQTINLETIRKFINIVDPKTFVNEIYLSDLKYEDKKAKIAKFINLQKLWFQEQLNKCQFTGIKWIVDNPTTQLTSSINPILENPKDWYGKYFR